MDGPLGRCFSFIIGISGVRRTSDGRLPGPKEVHDEEITDSGLGTRRWVKNNCVISFTIAFCLASTLPWLSSLVSGQLCGQGGNLGRNKTADGTHTMQYGAIYRMSGDRFPLLTHNNAFLFRRPPINWTIFYEIRNSYMPKLCRLCRYFIHRRRGLDDKGRCLALNLHNVGVTLPFWSDAFWCHQAHLRRLARK